MRMTPFQKGRHSEAVEEPFRFEEEKVQEKVDTSAPITLLAPSVLRTQRKKEAACTDMTVLGTTVSCSRSGRRE